jgi:hypothetical protein
LTSGGWPELNAFDGVVKREIQQQKTLQWLMFIFGVHWRSYKASKLTDLLSVIGGNSLN